MSAFTPHTGSGHLCLGAISITWSASPFANGGLPSALDLVSYAGLGLLRIRVRFSSASAWAFHSFDWEFEVSFAGASFKWLVPLPWSLRRPGLGGQGSCCYLLLLLALPVIRSSYFHLPRGFDRIPYAGLDGLTLCAAFALSGPSLCVGSGMLTESDGAPPPRLLVVLP